MAKRKKRKPSPDDITGQRLAGRLGAMEAMLMVALSLACKNDPNAEAELLAAGKTFAPLFANVKNSKYRESAEKHARALLNTALKAVRELRGIKTPKHPEIQ